MSSDEIKLNFCFIDLEEQEPITKDSKFSTLVKIIKNKFGNKTSNCSSGIKNCCETENTLIIAFATMRDLHEEKTYDNLIDKAKLRKISGRGDDFNFPLCPMIVIALEDLQGVLEETIKEQSSTMLENKLKIVKSLNLDPKVNFFDSSIWHYYVALNEDFLDNFKKILGEIKSNFELNIYKTNIAREFLEFQTRLLKNSYLANLGGGHASKVNPFQFHSSAEMKLKANRIVKEFFLGNSGEIAFRWRLLFVDDFVNNNLLIGKEVRGNGSGSSKTEIFEKILSVPDNKEEKEEYWLQIELCESVDGFIKRYSENDHEEKINDIILLDYLLGDKMGVNETGREYSIDILKWIKGELKNENGKPLDEQLNQDLQGPLDKFWFFPISVFSFAFMEDIRQMGYTHLEDEWHIVRGADPVNTPELFRYSLFKFMEMQINEVSKYKPKKDTENESPYKSGKISIRIFFESFFPKGDNLKSIQKNANMYYGNFIDFQNIYKKLLKDMKKGSLFARSILESDVDFDEAFWGHLHHLMFMLGHEPANEWPMMWDEFNIVEEKLKKIENKGDTEKIDYLDPIRDYIVDLQKQSRNI
ncbi:MAG: hypothetical protein ACTSU4_04710 [Promethearchaeota archaeon]